MRTLMSMNDVGVLAHLLPEWEHIVCRWQHVIYHTYTVDVHSIFLVEELRRLWRGKYARGMPALTELMREVDDSRRSILGCLLHDIGKGFGGDHSTKGVVRASRVSSSASGYEGPRRPGALRGQASSADVASRPASRSLRPEADHGVRADLRGPDEPAQSLSLRPSPISAPHRSRPGPTGRASCCANSIERAAEMLETGAERSGSGGALLLEARVERRATGAATELRALGVGDDKVDSLFDGCRGATSSRIRRGRSRATPSSY